MGEKEKENQESAAQQPGALRVFKGIFYKQGPLNRRRESRLIISPPLVCVVSYLLDSEKIDCLSEVVNISSKGMLLITGKNKLPEGAKTDVHFKFYSSADTLNVEAEVIRTYRLQLNDWYYSGLKFLEEDAKGLEAMIDFLLKKSPKDYISDQY